MGSWAVGQMGMDSSNTNNNQPSTWSPYRAPQTLTINLILRGAGGWATGHGLAPQTTVNLVNSRHTGHPSLLLAGQLGMDSSNTNNNQPSNTPWPYRVP